MRHIEIYKGKIKTKDVVLVDDCDFDTLSEHSWHLSTSGYVLRQFRKPDGKVGHVFMHRVILNPKAGEFVDHANRNKLDNRRSNLRIATKSQNAINTATKNKFGVPGIRFTYGKYRARIFLNQKEFHLGAFPSLDAAIAARKAASVRLHGEFACL